MVHLRARLARFVKSRRGRIPQREFARRTGLAQSTIMRIENLDQNVTLDTLEQLCRAFQVDVAELFPAVPLPRSYIDQRVEQPSVRSTQASAVHERKVDKAVTAGNKAGAGNPAKRSPAPSPDDCAGGN